MFKLLKILLIIIVFCILLFVRAVLPRYKIDAILKITWNYILYYSIALVFAAIIIGIAINL